MSCPFKLAALALFGTTALFAQPVIGGVVNGGSYAQPIQDSNAKPIGNNLVSQGAIFVIFGTGLGPASLVGSSALPLPTSLPAANGTSVTISSGGQTVSAFMVYSSAVQVAAILPSSTPIGAANVTVTFNGQTSAPYKISVVKSGVGVFTRNSQGTGPAIAQIAKSATDVSLNSLTNSAQAGDVMVIYATGLGAIAGPDNVPPGAVSAGTNVVVNIAGLSVPALYAGRSPNFPGLDQINFQVPANVSTGCYIPAEITATGQPSNLFYLSIASGSRVCTHPLGLPQDALARLDAGGTANTALFLMLRAVASGFPIEGTGGVFDTADANAAFQLTNRILYAFGGTNYPVASGSCAVLDSNDPGAGASVPDLSQVGGKELAAGAGITISGTNGNSQGILHNPTGGYSGIFASTLGAGTWTVAGTGGADVGAFAAKTSLPDNLIWTNAGNFSNVARGDVTITWSGGNLNPQSLVTISGSSVIANPTDPSKNRGKLFYCNAPASAGRFVIPAAIMQQIPASTTDPSAGEVAFGSLGVSTGNGSSFTAPLTGGKLDSGYLAYGEAYTLQVKYQ